MIKAQGHISNKFSHVLLTGYWFVISNQVKYDYKYFPSPTLATHLTLTRSKLAEISSIASWRFVPDGPVVDGPGTSVHLDLGNNW